MKYYDLMFQTISDKAIKDNTPCAIFSLEMSKEQLVQRMLCHYANVDLVRFMKGKLKPADWSSLHRVAKVLGDAPIYIDDSPAIKVSEIIKKGV